MSIEIFEISLKKHVSWPDLRAAMSFCTNINIDNITQSSKFWEIKSGDMAVDVVWRDRGYMTLITGYCNTPFYEERLLHLAQCLSSKLNTDSAIGDYVTNKKEKTVTDSYIICKPKGITTSGIVKENGQWFDLSEGMIRRDR
jgi:glucan-binding YG repeat protein